MLPISTGEIGYTYDVCWAVTTLTYILLPVIFGSGDVGGTNAHASEAVKESVKRLMEAETPIWVISSE